MPKLKLTVIHARDLDAKDMGGTSDPFVKIKIGTLQVKTEIVKKNCNPDWNAVFNLDLPAKFDPEFESIYFDVYDYDRFSSNDLIGKTSARLDNLEKGIAQQMTLNLHNAHKGTLTIELLAEDFGIIPEIKPPTLPTQQSVHNRSATQLNYNHSNINNFNTQPPTPPPPQYDSSNSSPPPPQYYSNNQSSVSPPQYPIPNQPPPQNDNSFNSQPPPPQYSDQSQCQPPPPQYSDQSQYPNQNFQGYPPIGYSQPPPPSYPPQYNQ
ncbi:predicted protein [Naegleria gruberi]|uniref:Predicted protein n=1 Tax=Naegleria gruberi TaxID=5762 RepID=D2VWZ0_NAEGR|nr:uncharacterized protein NAEGRDRAFT_73554 [Naegleria gruberi]EFC38773.1 predicted protein [Naegleria gruberi]|eukprot:XP_002671517.1 predicted protein [Naegleria gruberi strain NEG-M]